MTGRKQCAGQPARNGSGPGTPAPACRMTTWYKRRLLPPTTGMWLSQNASMRRHPGASPESDDSAVRDQDRPETHSTPDTAFARRNGAYRPEQIMEERQNGWMDQPLANSDHHPGLYTGSSDPLMWGQVSRTSGFAVAGTGLLFALHAWRSAGRRDPASTQQRRPTLLVSASGSIPGSRCRCTSNTTIWQPSAIAWMDIATTADLYEGAPVMVWCWDIPRLPGTMDREGHRAERQRRPPRHRDPGQNSALAVDGRRQTSRSSGAKAIRRLSRC